MHQDIFYLYSTSDETLGRIIILPIHKYREIKILTSLETLFWFPLNNQFNLYSYSCLSQWSWNQIAMALSNLRELWCTYQYIATYKMTHYIWPCVFVVNGVYISLSLGKISFIDYSLFNTSKSHISYVSYILCLIVRSSLIIYVDEQESERNYRNNWDVK